MQQVGYFALLLGSLEGMHFYNRMYICDLNVLVELGQSILTVSAINWIYFFVSLSKKFNTSWANKLKQNRSFSCNKPGRKLVFLPNGVSGCSSMTCVTLNNFFINTQDKIMVLEPFEKSISPFALTFKWFAQIIPLKSIIEKVLYVHFYVHVVHDSLFCYDCACC